MFLFSSCTNLFHDLLPSDKKEIIDFQIQYVNGTCSEKYSPNDDNNIEIVVPNDTDVKKLIPVVSISEGSEIVPLTVSYIAKIFPEKDILTLAIDMYLARENGTFESWFINLILDNGGIEIPKLDMPIDFSTPVNFVVISGSGNYEFYTVTVKKELPTQDDDDDNTPDEPEIKEETDNFILSFKVPNQIGESKIYNSIAEIEDEELNEDINSIGDKVPYSGLISFEVGADFDLKEVIPTVTVSEGAKILPLTEEYILSLGISFVDMINFYSGYSTTTNVERYISDFLKKQNNIVYPEINIPLNFDNTNVSFAVVSESGSIKIYNVKCKQVELNPKLTKIIFSKLNNEFLCKDSIGTITDNTIKATCMHPMEMEFDYGLIPEFVYEGDRVTFTMKDGIETELISGVTKIPFTETNRICVISVYIGSGETEKKIEYELYCPIEYDPDSIRSIIDFRFYKSKNTQIKNTVLASIHNEGDTGFITATVMYEGEVAPYELVADFVSPGTVTKNGAEIITGVTSENFEYSTQYLCTSKNGLYCRLYDISIKFMQIVTIEPVINSFEFPSYLNKDLSKDCIAQIDELTKTIRCEVLYHSSKPPYDLIPSFVSSGTVTCDGMTQTSGFSGQNFRYTNYYTVTTGDIELSTSRYRIEVVFLKDDSSSCDILDFGFKIENNASLSSDVQATVTERTQKIFAFMPYGAGSQSGTLLTPTFTSNGTVSVNGQTQTSGISSQDFSSPITYTVTSLNGLYTKEYVVSLQESGSIIYVDKKAVGRNNGTSWDDAFINLDTALEYVNSIDDSVLQEVWITADEYEPILNSKNGFNIRSNLILRGGFEGTESASNDRLVDSENCLENHTVLKRQPLNSDEESLFYANENFTGTFTIDGFDIDLEQSANETFLDIIKVLNPIDVTENSKVEVNNCLLSVKTQNGGCRLFYSEKDSDDLWDTVTKPTNNIKILNTKINAATLDGISVTSHTGEVLIQNTKTNCKLSMVGKSVTIEDTSFDNQLYTITEKPDDQFHLTNLNDSDSSAQIKNSYFNNLVIKAYHDITMEDSILENCALHTATNGLSNLNILNTTLNLVNINGYALEYGSLCMKNSTMEANTCRGSNLIQIEDSEFTVYNLKAWASFQNTCYYEGNSFIKNSTITATGSSVVLGGYIGGSTQYYASKDFYIENSKFKGSDIYFYSENLTIKDSDFSLNEKSNSYEINFGTKNLVLEGNDFDTSLYTPSKYLISNGYIYSINNYVKLGFYNNITLESSEINNNVFGNLLCLYFGHQTNASNASWNFEKNYFETGACVDIPNSVNVSFTSNTFEDLEIIDVPAAIITKYENNKVINKNSNRGYKYISAKEFPYTEFNYENFCYIYSSGELVFNNCIIEPSTQTYSLPQGEFTFNYSDSKVIARSTSYMTFNNCIVNSDFENNETIVVKECTNFQIGRLDNYGDFTINDSYVQYGNITNHENGNVVFNDSSISGNFIYNYSNFEFNNINSTFIGLSNYGKFTINNSNVTNGEYIWDEGTFTINNTIMNLKYNGTICLYSKGDLSINGGTYNFVSSQGRELIYATGTLSINGGTFNFEHTGGGSNSPMNVICDATISNAKFNFTGDEYSGSDCVAFINGTNGSTIKNCEFIIDKCAGGGFYAGQAGLKIENSKFDINVYPENNGDICYGFYASKSFSIDGGTYDLGEFYVNSSTDMSIKNATMTAINRRIGISVNSVIDNSSMYIIETELTAGSVLNYSDNISDTKFYFSLRNKVKRSNSTYHVWKNYSSKLTNCLFDFSEIPGSGCMGAGLYQETSCYFERCTFNGAINLSTDNFTRGAAVLISTKLENQGFIFDNCIFSNNKLLGGTAQGGAGLALIFDAENSYAILRSCTFKDNDNNSDYWYGYKSAHLIAFGGMNDNKFTNCQIILEGENIMENPSCPEIKNAYGTKFYNDAVWLYNIRVIGTVN